MRMTLRVFHFIFIKKTIRKVLIVDNERFNKRFFFLIWLCYCYGAMSCSVIELRPSLQSIIKCSAVVRRKTPNGTNM